MNTNIESNKESLDPTETALLKFNREIERLECIEKTSIGLIGVAFAIAIIVQIGLVLALLNNSYMN